MKLSTVYKQTIYIVPKPTNKSWRITALKPQNSEADKNTTSSNIKETSLYRYRINNKNIFGDRNGDSLGYYVALVAWSYISNSKYWLVTDKQMYKWMDGHQAISYTMLCRTGIIWNVFTKRLRKFIRLNFRWATGKKSHHFIHEVHTTNDYENI